VSHAEEVERLTLEIARSPEHASHSIDTTVLRAAALLHDVGYAKADASWSPGKAEHLREGVRIAQEVLRNVPPFGDDLRRLDQVCHLILRHDSTNYSFPILHRGGRTATPAGVTDTSYPSEYSQQERQQIQSSLLILQEADSRTGTGREGAQRTLEYSLSRGVPPFAKGNPLDAWMWEESVVGNVRLAAKRAILDAHTLKGKDYAWQGYLDADEVVKGFCEEKNVAYREELCLGDLQDRSRSVANPTISIERVQTWEELVSTLRWTRLYGDPLQFPYASARIEYQLVEIDRLSALSLYVLTDQIGLHEQLRRSFLSSYALDPLDLSGIVDLRRGTHLFRIAPPIVEVYTETEGDIKGEIWALVDGLHRCALARKLGLPHISAVVIFDAPKRFPLVPLPLRWEQVQERADVPEPIAKRKFRYPSLGSFPEIPWSSVKITKDNYLYFFYRDLSRLGSSGIRKGR